MLKKIVQSLFSKNIDICDTLAFLSMFESVKEEENHSLEPDLYNESVIPVTEI